MPGWSPDVSDQGEESIALPRAAIEPEVSHPHEHTMHTHKGLASPLLNSLTTGLGLPEKSLTHSSDWKAGDSAWRAESVYVHLHVGGGDINSGTKLAAMCRSAVLLSMLKLIRIPLQKLLLCLTVILTEHTTGHKQTSGIREERQWDYEDRSKT